MSPNGSTTYLGRAEGKERCGAAATPAAAAAAAWSWHHGQLLLLCLYSLLLLHAARGGGLKEGVREEEGLGDADGEEEEKQEDGKKTGRWHSAGHAAALATGPWHAAARRLCGLVCEVVGMGMSNRTR